MNLLKTLAKVSSMTMFSRILGFIRDAIIARYFGASVAADAFFVAFKIPNLLRRIFAEGAFSQAFVPILAEYKNQKGLDETKIFVAHIAGLLTIMLSIITLIGVMIAPAIILVTAPGFSSSSEKYDLAVLLLQILFPYIFFISLTSFVGSLLNTWNTFVVPAFAPALLNICMILAVLFASPNTNPPIMPLAISVLIGGLLQLIYQLPYLKRIGMLVMPKISFKNSGVWRVLKQMVPAILGVSVGQVSLIINTIFASFLVTGSVSWMYYADRLMELPSGVLGVALGTILLPSLSKSFAKGDYQQYSELLNWGLKLCFLLAVPSAAALCVLSKPIIAALFEYGKFTTHDALMTQQALIAYSFGLVALMLIKVLAPGFYSIQNIKTPVKIALITLVLTQLMNLIFIEHFKHAGLALSISLAACFNALILFLKLKKTELFKLESHWLSFIIKIIISVIIMSAVLIVVCELMPNWSDGSMFSRIARLMLVVILGVITYFGSLILLKIDLKKLIKRT